MELQQIHTIEPGREMSNTCRALLEHLSGYLDQELERALCEELDEHLHACPDCRTLVDTMRRTILLVHQQGRTPMPPAAYMRLLHGLHLDTLQEKQ